MTQETTVFERVGSYEDACTELGIQPINVEELKAAGLTDAEIARRKLETITKALNEGEELSWENRSQEKWMPYFYFSPSGFVFHVSLYYDSYAYAGYAVRLCFKDEKRSSYAGRTFIDLYKIIIND